MDMIDASLTPVRSMPPTIRLCIIDSCFLRIEMLTSVRFRSVVGPLQNTFPQNHSEWRTGLGWFLK